MEVGPHKLALGLHFKLVLSTVAWARVVRVGGHWQKNVVEIQGVAKTSGQL